MPKVKHVAESRPDRGTIQRDERNWPIVSCAILLWERQNYICVVTGGNIAQIFWLKISQILNSLEFVVLVAEWG